MWATAEIKILQVLEESSKKCASLACRGCDQLTPHICVRVARAAGGPHCCPQLAGLSSASAWEEEQL